MAFIDVIDNYAQGQTGTLTDADGQTVNYTVTDGATTINRANHGDFSARIGGQGQDTVEVTFDEPVVGASITFQGSDNNEFYNVLVDGVVVNLADLVASGDATFANVGTVSTHTLNSDGTISGGVNNDGSIGQIIFNIPVISIGAVGAGSPNNGNFDGIEIGIDDGVFNVVCFTSGTMITTPEGIRAVETLRVGDIVQTLDGAGKPIRWIGSRYFGRAVLERQENLRPIRISAGALGYGLPKQDLLVSRQHRILVSSKVATRMFGVNDVLIAAIKLTEMPGIFVDQAATDVRYFHILFDEHEVVFAEGTPTESLHTGVEGLKTMTLASRKKIFAVFPELEQSDARRGTACLVPSGKMQKQLVERHAKNRKPLLELFDAFSDA
ncbi:Hint domain-containing protein [Yoonia sp.]|uniref:Hint domain-containing protein n=1 Tax=Yoonia sp. TaxID=2212373 RepID=UPI0025F26F37|nr:Hint domain-containing protein [Yoonia sp.]